MPFDAVIREQTSQRIWVSVGMPSQGSVFGFVPELLAGKDVCASGAASCNIERIVSTDPGILPFRHEANALRSTALTFSYVKSGASFVIPCSVRHYGTADAIWFRHDVAAAPPIEHILLSKASLNVSIAL